MRNPTPVTTNSMASESWSSENEYSTLKFPERNHVSGCGSTYGSDKEENWLAIHNDMKNAAPQNISAANATNERFTPLSISSMDIKMVMMLRLIKNPVTPHANRIALRTR